MYRINPAWLCIGVPAGENHNLYRLAALASSSYDATVGELPGCTLQPYKGSLTRSEALRGELKCVKCMRIVMITQPDLCGMYMYTIYMSTILDIFIV